MPNSLYGRAAAAAVVALVAGVALAAGVREVLPLGAAYPLKATVCFAVVAAIAVGRINRANHPFAEFGPANQVTAARAVFVGLIAGLIGEVSQPAVAAVAAAGAIAVTAMDGVDGWLARRTKMSSAFGARFDMEVDALLILILSVLAWQYEKAGAWVMLSGLLRYVFVLAGWVWPWMERPLEPSRRRQTVCVVQVAALIAVIEPFVTPPLSSVVAAFALGVLAGSFLIDTRWLVLHRREQVA
jgi:phosphatidylglycerophosphate synthase